MSTWEDKNEMHVRETATGPNSEDTLDTMISRTFWPAG